MSDEPTTAHDCRRTCRPSCGNCAMHYTPKHFYRQGRTICELTDRLKDSGDICPAWLPGCDRLFDERKED